MWSRGRRGVPFSLTCSGLMNPDGSVALLIKRQSFPGGPLAGLFRTDHSCQRRKLLGERHCIGAVNSELALADHVDQFNAGEHAVGAQDRFEVEHRPGHPLNGETNGPTVDRRVVSIRPGYEHRSLPDRPTTFANATEPRFLRGRGKRSKVRSGGTTPRMLHPV